MQNKTKWRKQELKLIIDNYMKKGTKTWVRETKLKHEIEDNKKESRRNGKQVDRGFVTKKIT